MGRINSLKVSNLPPPIMYNFSIVPISRGSFFIKIDKLTQINVDE